MTNSTNYITFSLILAELATTGANNWTDKSLLKVDPDKSLLFKHNGNYKKAKYDTE